MILKYEVIKNNQVVHSGGASSVEDVHLQLKPYYEHKTFGEPERTIQVLVQEATEESEAVYEDQIIPAEYDVVITDITAVTEANKIEAEKVATGEMIKTKCEKAISLILAYNMSFTFEQIDQLEEDFGEIYNFLMKRRIDKAYFLLDSAQPTELITQEFLNQLKTVLIG